MIFVKMGHKRISLIFDGFEWINRVFMMN